MRKDLYSMLYYLYPPFNNAPPFRMILFSYGFVNKLHFTALVELPERVKVTLTSRLPDVGAYATNSVAGPVL